MPESPNRQRLAQLMEQRRKDLRLRWQDVAERSGLSLKTLHSVRSSDKRVAELTKTGIEDGLRWEHGSIDLVLAGGEPAPLPDSDPGSHETAALSVLPGSAPLPDNSPPSPGAVAFARAVGIDPDDPDDPFLRPVRRAIAEAIMRHGTGATGSQIFHDYPGAEVDAQIWDDPRAPRQDKDLYLAIMRADRARDEARRRNGASRIGLAAPAPRAWPALAVMRT